MAAPTIDTTKPDPGNVWNTDVDQLRDNISWLMIAAAGQGYVLPGWTTTATGADLSQPDAIYMVDGSLKMKWGFTWSTGGDLTQQVWQYDRGLGAGYETLTEGTITLAYDGGGNFSGATVV